MLDLHSPDGFPWWLQFVWSWMPFANNFSILVLASYVCYLSRRLARLEESPESKQNDPPAKRDSRVG